MNNFTINGLTLKDSNKLSGRYLKCVDGTGASTWADLPTISLGFALSDETTTITSGTSKLTFYMPHGLILTDVRGCLSTSGSTQTIVNINQTGTTIFSTKLTIDSGLYTLKDSAAQPVITGTTLYDNSKITFDIDGAGTAAKGLKVFLIGNKI